MTGLRHLEDKLAARREALIKASAGHREVLRGYAAGFAPLFAVADAALAGAQWARRHGPVLAALAGIGMLVLRPRRMLALATRAWSVWGAYRLWRGRAMGLLARLQTRGSP